jgi:hypothetical protein
VRVEVLTAADFSIFYCNPNAVTDNESKKHIVIEKESFQTNDDAGPFYGGNTYYYLNIRTKINSIVTTTLDTILVNGSYTYTINL